MPLRQCATGLYRIRPALRRLVLRALGLAVAVPTGTAAAVLMGAAWRRRRGQAQGFPHSTVPAVHVGENTIHLYSYGRALYAAMLDAIDAAQESIYLETFLWKDDAIGQEFKDRLARKAAQGIDVYVAFDWFGNLVVPAAFKAFPSAIHTLVYRPIQEPWHLLDPRRYALEHRKLLVVDGRRGFLGGYNLGQLYATAWRDTHFSVAGPAAAQLAQIFADLLERACAPCRPHHPALSTPVRGVIRAT